MSTSSGNLSKVNWLKTRESRDYSISGEILYSYSLSYLFIIKKGSSIRLLLFSFLQFGDLFSYISFLSADMLSWLLESGLIILLYSIMPAPHEKLSRIFYFSFKFSNDSQLRTPMFTSSKRLLSEAYRYWKRVISSFRMSKWRAWPRKTNPTQNISQASIRWSYQTKWCSACSSQSGCSYQVERILVLKMIMKDEGKTSSNLGQNTTIKHI